MVIFVFFVSTFITVNVKVFSCLPFLPISLGTRLRWCGVLLLRMHAHLFMIKMIQNYKDALRFHRITVKH